MSLKVYENSSKLILKCHLLPMRYYCYSHWRWNICSWIWAVKVTGRPRCVSSGSVQVRYNLGGLKEPFTIDVDQRNMANGQPHSINVSRVNRSITIQVPTTHRLCTIMGCGSLSSCYSTLTSWASVGSMARNKSEGIAVSCSIFHCDETACPLPLLIHFQETV